MLFADLHLHSTYSDGTQTVRQLCDSAVRHNVSLIAVTDHNRVGGVSEALAYARNLPLTVIPGVELDAQLGDTVFHVLGLYVDVSDEAFVGFINENLQKQESANRELIVASAKNDSRVSPNAYDAFVPGVGGWKALHYLKSVGVVSTIMEVMPLYGKYGITPEGTGFATVARVCEAIRQAGGISVIAHPIDMLGFTDTQTLLAGIDRLVSEGVMGVECFYPSHSSEQEEALVDYCARKGLYVTGGSDCHGDFFNRNKQNVGSQFVQLDRLILP